MYSPMYVLVMLVFISYSIIIQRLINTLLKASSNVFINIIIF